MGTAGMGMVRAVHALSALLVVAGGSGRSGSDWLPVWRLLLPLLQPLQPWMLFEFSQDSLVQDRRALMQQVHVARLMQVCVWDPWC